MRKLSFLFVSVFAALALAACGGGGGGGGGAGPAALPAMATVAVTVSDSSTPETDRLIAALLDGCDEGGTGDDCLDPPAECPDGSTPDNGDCEPDEPSPELLVEVTTVTLLGPDGPEEIFDGSRVVDLFKLKDGVELKFLAAEAKPGVYDKIRLRVEGEPMLFSEEYPDGLEVKLPGNKIDLNPREEFRLLPGDTVLIELDWHANRSLKLNTDPPILRPVIFVSIEVESRLLDRIVRVSGIVGDIEDDEFELCMAAFIQPIRLPGDGDAPPTANEGDSGDGDDEECIDVIVTDKTGLFDENGEPKMLEDLSEGDPLTVIGLLRVETDDPLDECDEAAIPENECNEVTPLTAMAHDNGNGRGHSDSDSDSDSDSGNGNGNGNGSDDRDRPGLEIIAAVVECGPPGTWIRERGTLETAPDGMGEFDFRLAGPEGRLLTGKIYPETRIFMRSEEDGIMEISAEELAAGDRAIVEAVFIPGDDQGPTPKQAPQDCDEASIPEECQEVPEKLDGTLRIAIMLVTLRDDGGEPPPVPAESVDGTLLSVDLETGQLIVATVVGDRCVNTDEDTTFLQVVNTEEDPDFLPATIEDLEVGSFVLATGDTGGCIDANVVVARGPDELPDTPTPEPQ